MVHRKGSMRLPSVPFVVELLGYGTGSTIAQKSISHLSPMVASYITSQRTGPVMRKLMV
jgi:hypothetical protein